jgi:hypothetical protein
VTDEPIYGSARLRVLNLPNGQFLLIMDRAGFVAVEPDKMEEWLILRNLTLSRMGPECVGFFRFAGECEISERLLYDQRGVGRGSGGVYQSSDVTGARPGS